MISMCANTEYHLSDAMDTIFLKSPSYPQPYNVQSDCQTTVNIDSDIKKTALTVIDNPDQLDSPLRIYLCGSDIEVNVRVNILPTRCEVLNGTKMSNKATSYFFQLYKFTALEEQRGILLELHRSEYPFLMYCFLRGPRLMYCSLRCLTKQPHISSNCINSLLLKSRGEFYLSYTEVSIPSSCIALSEVRASYFFQLYKFSASEEQRGILLEQHKSKFPFLSQTING